MSATFLGVVNRNGVIYIPWTGATIPKISRHPPGTNLIVTLDNNGEKFISARLPSLKAIKQMKEESHAAWLRFEQIFEQELLLRKTRMLRALNEVMKEYYL